MQNKSFFFITSYVQYLLVSGRNEFFAKKDVAYKERLQSILGVSHLFISKK